MGDHVWGSIPGARNLSQYITSHPGQLSLAIPPWVGIMTTSQRAVMPCGWVVKAGMVCEWVAGRTVWSPCYHGSYLSALAMSSSHNKALYKCPITLFYFTYFKVWFTWNAMKHSFCAIRDLLAVLGPKNRPPCVVYARDSTIPGAIPQNRRRPVWDVAKRPCKISRRLVKPRLSNPSPYILN